MKKILIIGAGAMGSAFSVPCVDNNEVTLVGTFLENELISKIKSNNNFHPSLNINLPSKINIQNFDNLKNIIKKGIDIIVVAVSSVGIDWVGDEISKFYMSQTPIILLTKGLSINNDQLITLSEKLELKLKSNGHKQINISSVKGPCLASGLANKMRTDTVIANKNIKDAQKIQKIIQTEYYKCEISDDISGVSTSTISKHIVSGEISAKTGIPPLR